MAIATSSLGGLSANIWKCQQNLGHDSKTNLGVPYDVYIFLFEKNSWKKITNYIGDSGIHRFDILKNGKKSLCSYSSDWSEKKRGTYIMDLDTKEMDKITDWAGSYKIMPDQKSFLATRAIVEGKKVISMSEITLFNLETGEERILTRDGVIKSTPTISQDGKKILYSSHIDVGERIFMIDLETGKKREIFDRKPGYAGKIPHDRSPDWAPS